MSQINPYELGLGAAEQQLAEIGSRARSAKARGETTKKIEGMKAEFEHRAEKATKEAEDDIEKSEKEAEKARKEAERKGGRFGGVFKGLKTLAFFLNPLYAALLAGSTTGIQSQMQKKSLKGLKGGLTDISEQLKDAKVDLGTPWKTRTSGLNWLSSPTKDVESRIADSFKSGSKYMLQGAKEAGRAAGKINPLEQALMSGLTTYAMGEAMGQEGIFSKDAALTGGVAAQPAVYDMAMDPITGEAIQGELLSGAIPGIASTKVPFGQRLKEHFIGTPGVYDGETLVSGMSKGDRTEQLLQQLAMYQGVLGEEFTIPEINW